MEVFTSSNATAEFSQRIRTLKSNHKGCCALVLEWTSDGTPPWLGKEGDGLFIKPLTALTIDEPHPPCVLLLPEGPLVILLQQPHYATYVLLISFFDSIVQKLNLPSTTFKPYDLTLEWSSFFTACTHINASVGKSAAPSPNDDYIAKLASTLTTTLGQNDDRHLKNRDLRLLFVEDDAATRQLLKHLSGAGNITINTAENGEEAIKSYASAPPHIIFLDINLPDITGLALLDLLYKNDPMVYPVMLTSHSSQDQVSYAMQRRIKGYIIKPFNKQNILDCIDRYRKETHHA